MPGLPSVKGTIHVNVQVVEDPGYPDPPPPLPALQVTDPAVQARLREFRAKYQATQFAFVSATVYDHSRTFLRVYPNGESKNVVSGWSNLDFNFFGGFASYQVKGANGEVRKYFLLMGIGNVDTTRTSELLKKHGKAYQIPVHPALPALATKGPIFIADEGSLSDGKVMHIAQDMHALYQVEGARMESAYYARSKAAEERRAYLLAHPPVPEDVTIRFWKRTPTIAPQPQTEGAQ